MKNQFQAKLLQHLASKKKANKGFTLIELLVVVIIVGILAAVALPNLLGQVGKARETEGKNGVGAINRSQQAYHFEKQAFTPSIADGTASGQLGNVDNRLGVVVASSYYTFTVGDGDGAVTAVAKDAKKDGVRNYAGVVGFLDGLYTTGICQGTGVGVTSVAASVSGTPPAVSCTNGDQIK